MSETEYYLLGKKVTQEEFEYFKSELTFANEPVSEGDNESDLTVYFAADPDGRQFEYREKLKGAAKTFELERMPEENY